MDQWQLYTTNGFGFLGKPTTELMGWRRLTPNELLNLDVGSFFLLSIPPDSRLEDKDTIKLRSAFKPSYLSLFSRSLVFYMSFY